MIQLFQLFHFFRFFSLALELHNFENLVHYGKVRFAEQDLNVLFDTGSSLTWVASEDCLSCGMTGNKKFDQFKSRTFRALDMSFEIRYGSGSIRGELAMENIELDGIFLENVEIGVVFEEEGITFKKIPVNGIVALAPGQPKASLIGRMKEKQIENVEIDLAVDEFGTGSIKFFKEYSIFKEKNLKDDKWMAKFDSILLGTLDFCYLMNSCRAVVDTGSSLNLLPKNVFREVLKRYRVSADCSNIGIVPDLEFYLRELVFELQANDIVLFDQGFCSLAFMQMDLNDQEGEFLVLGGTFIRNNIIILDFSSESIAIRSKHPLFSINKLVKNPN
jgi:hypothetical protein